MQELKGVRKEFEAVHHMTFAGNPPPPHSEDRKKPVELSVGEEEFAHGIIVDWVLRLAPRKSRRLNVLLWHMKRLRRATLRSFPAYDDAISARRLRARVAAACREHRATLRESAEDMGAVVENRPYLASLGTPYSPKYPKMDKYEMFQQAVDYATASVLCQEIEPQTEEDDSTAG